MRFGREYPLIGTVTWESWFAWRPVRLKNGRWVWLERIKVRYSFVESPFRARGIWIWDYYPIEQIEFPPRY